MGRVAGERIQQVGKDPLVDLMTSTCGQIHEADATLSRATCPTDLPAGVDAQAGKSQLKAHSHALLLAEWRNRLDRHPFMVKVAHDSTIGLIKSDVGQRAQLMAMVSACLPRGNTDDLQPTP